MATQQQRSERTRRNLMNAFRSSFLKRGFESTTTQHVLAETGLSKGALYHHFHSKSEVMEAIYREESLGAIERALESVDAAAPPLARLRDACIAWTREVQSPEVSRILFEIGPSALGQHQAKLIEDSFSLRHFEAFLKEANDRGEIELADPKLGATMLNALVSEATLYTLRTGRSSTDMLIGTLNALFVSLKP